MSHVLNIGVMVKIELIGTEDGSVTEATSVTIPSIVKRHDHGFGNLPLCLSIFARLNSLSYGDIHFPVLKIHLDVVVIMKCRNFEEDISTGSS